MDSDQSRREFLRKAGLGVAGLAAASAAGAGGAQLPALARTKELPAPAESGIDHIVLVMMENRSFDHYLGWLDDADGRQAGLHYVDRDGVRHATHHLTTFQGCDNPDPDHSFEGGRIQFNGGRCDGWLRSGENDEYAIGYYTRQDLAFYGQAARYWTTCDRYFAAFLGPTFPNRLYQHAAQTDRITNAAVLATMPTIWDRLADAGLTRTYYFSDLPVTALWGTRYLDISRPYRQFLADCAAGTLPAVSFLDPRFQGEGEGTSGDDHPHADIRVGQRFLNDVYEAVSSSPNWGRTVLMINYDEWGGFFDHVAPPVMPDVNPQWGQLGFRVPALVISPLAKRHLVAHDVYDHTSVLKMIEWRWGLPPLTPRDAAANNLAEVLDFGKAPDLTAPRWDVPEVVPAACPPAHADIHLQWTNLRQMAVAHGWSQGTGGRLR